MRMAERILVVCGGILSIYLGYLLFQIASLKSESAGTFKSAVFEFTVSKVGPGVFFALFGAYILYASVSHAVMTETTTGAQAGLTPDVIGQLDSDQMMKTRDAAIGELTTLVEKLPSSQDKAAGENALKRLRTAISDTKFIGNDNTPRATATMLKP
jgi:hypothetical protein